LALAFLTFAGFFHAIPTPQPGTSAMSEDRILPIAVTALRADEYSADGRHVVIALRTRYSNTERKYSVPIECFHDLIVDLQRLNGPGNRTPIEASIRSAADASAAHVLADGD
jgi:hypothetical protein